MLSIKKMLTKPSFAFLISVLLGLGLASIFRKACSDRSCLVIQTIPPKKLIGKKLRRDGNCYEWVPQTVN